MRSFLLFLSLLLIVVLSGCGSEEELNPPTFSDITINGSTDLTSPVDQSPVKVAGRIGDSAAKIVANSLLVVEETIPVVVVDNGDGSKSYTWQSDFPLLAGSNAITLTATDARGNINQLFLTVFYAPLTVE